jgi:arylsulfatase A-like enzyme
MADRPALYASRFYAAGGLGRTVQVFATDVLGPGGVGLVALGAALVYARPLRLLALGRRASADSGRELRRGAAALAVVGLAGAGPAKETGAPAEASTARGRPNVLLLAVDGLRADGLEARVAPALTELAARGGRFERAYVSNPSAVPSWVTLLTGRYPHRHGVTSALAGADARARDKDGVPARLARAGYATAALSDASDDAFATVALGFTRVASPPFDRAASARAERLARHTALVPLLASPLGRSLLPETLAPLEGRDPGRLADDVAVALHALASQKGRPFLLVASFGAARAPFAAPSPYYAKYTDRRYRGRFKYAGPEEIEVESPLARDPPSGPPLDEADRRQLRTLHDGAVRAVDDGVARVLESLAREGLAGNTVVVLTAAQGDPGDGEGRRDLLGDASTHVPLVLYDPRIGEGARVTRLARDVDLAPTLYELTGVPPPGDLDGRSLVAALRGRDLAPRVACAASALAPADADVEGAARRMPVPPLGELTEDEAGAERRVLRPGAAEVLEVARQRMCRDERWKLVYAPTRQRAEYMLFDTLVAPAEARDVAADRPAEVSRLRAALSAWSLEDPRLEARDGSLVPRVRLGPGGGLASPPEDEVALRLAEAVDAAKATRIGLPGGPGEPRLEVRHAILAAPPSRFSFELTVPRGAVLTFAEGASPGAAAEAVTFVVTVADATSAAHELYRHRVEPAHDGRWSEASCDLSAYAGRTILLHLSTESTPSPGRALALWGSPALLARASPRLPANVLWVVVDAVPGLAPSLDALARRGVRFPEVHVASVGALASTVAMLSGARSSELGLPPGASPPRAVALASRPPTLPLLAGREGAVARAFVSTDALSDVGAGLDLGFDVLGSPGRAAAGAPEATTRDALAWLRANPTTRFFLFVSHVHGDADLGALLDGLTDGQRERTVVVVTADHAEGAVAGSGLAAATRVPAVIVAPGRLPGDRVVPARVRTTDLAPTVAELLGLELDPVASGASLVPLARGAREPDERVVLTELPGGRALLHGRHRLVVRDDPPREALHDVVDDPGERRDLGAAQPARVDELRARLAAALANAPVAGSFAATASPAPGSPGGPRAVHLRFVGAGRARRVAGTITVGDARVRPRSVVVLPVGLGRDAWRTAGDRTEVAFTTREDAAVGFDLLVDPPATPVAWELYLDDQAWPADAVFAGPYGLRAPALRDGLTRDEHRREADAARPPLLYPRRELGLFVTRDPRP